MYHTSHTPSAIFQKLKQLFDCEPPQKMIWAPFWISLGIAIYFSLLQEPSFIFGCLSVTLFALIMYLGRHHTLIVMVGYGICLMSLGFTAATYRTISLSTPMLKEILFPQRISGIIDTIECLPQSQKIILKTLDFERLRYPLHKIQLNCKEYNQTCGLQPGMYIEVKAMLFPPSEPTFPGTYDFRRRAYFEGIGGIGRIQHTPVILKSSIQNSSFVSLIVDGIQRMRHLLTQKLSTTIGGTAGAIAAALITGDRAGIDDVVRQSYARSGIAHVLAISGLHVNLVAGIIFLCVRLGLTLCSKLSLRYNIKKWAASLSIVAIFLYLLICNAPTSAKRAFIMTCLILIGILKDRQALTVRNIAVAACIILLIFPESLLSPSFQLSFAAVTALVGGYEYVKPFLDRLKNFSSNWLWKICFYVCSITVTTVLATLVTIPLTIYTFNQFSVQAIVANMIVIPLTCFIIMPSLILLLILMPFGCDTWLAFGLHHSINLMTDIATTIATWSGSVILVSQISSLTVGIITLGFMIFLTFKTHLKWISLVVFAVASVLFVKDRPANLCIAQNGQFISFYLKPGYVWTTSLLSKPYLQNSWLQSLGEQKLHLLPVLGTCDHNQIICNKPIYTLLNRYQLTLQKKNLQLIDLQTKTVLLDQIYLRKYGNTLVWLNDSVPKIKSVKNPKMKRPWTIGIK